MTTIDVQVVDGADDAHESDDGTGFAGANSVIQAIANTVASDRVNGGFRFQSVAVPKDTVPDVAYVTAVPNTTSTDDVNVDIHAEDADNAVSFVTTPDVTSRTRTTNSANWDATSLGASPVNSPSIISPLQELFARGSWASGNNLVILMDGVDAANKNFRVKSYEGDAANALKLHIEYSVSNPYYYYAQQ